jgi:hypothetical protein
MLRIADGPRSRPFSTIGAETMSNRNPARAPNPGKPSQRSIGSQDPRKQQAQGGEASRQQSQGDPGSQPGSRSSSYGMGSQGEGSSQRQTGTSNLPRSPDQSEGTGASPRDDDEGVSRR